MQETVCPPSVRSASKPRFVSASARMRNFRLGASCSLLTSVAMAVDAYGIGGGVRYVDFQASGCAETAPLTNFPVLVRLSSSTAGFDYARCSNGGLDRTFGLADGTPLPREILATGGPTNFTYTFTGVPTTLTWFFDRAFLVSVAADAAAVAFDSQPDAESMVAEGSSITLTATADLSADPYAFVHWSGDLPGDADPFASRIVLTVDAPTAVFRHPTYLKADAAGDNTGLTWKNACTNLPGAITAAKSQDGVIFAAAGVYRVATYIDLNDSIELYGGFAGEAGEAIGPRDTDLRQTIVTGDQNGDDAWMHVAPVPGEFRLGKTPVLDGEDNPLRVIGSDGRVNVPSTFAATSTAMPSTPRRRMTTASRAT